MSTDRPVDLTDLGRLMGASDEDTEAAAADLEAAGIAERVEAEDGRVLLVAGPNAGRRDDDEPDPEEAA